MKGWAVLALALTLAACAPGQGQREPGRLRPAANPSAVIAAELAFARMARERGQWTAFRATAADDAIMFVPRFASAQDWLKGRADPPTSVVWEPSRVVTSCDGALSASFGEALWPDNSKSHFMTLWRRQQGGDGYKWVLDTGETIAEPSVMVGGAKRTRGSEKPEFIATVVASCVVPPAAGALDGFIHTTGGASPDRTLVWGVSHGGESDQLRVAYWDGARWVSLYDRRYR